ncbi:MAG: VCBS repeat-containing protein [Planctomycetota bacterium]
MGDENYEALADLDQNGTLDGVVSSASGWHTVLDVGTSPTFGSFIPGLVGQEFNALGDVTGDGLADLVVRYNELPAPGTSGVRVYTGRGDGSFDPPLELPGPNLTWNLVLADVDGDGTHDVVTYDTQTVPGVGTNYQANAWILDGAVPFAAPPQLLPTFAGQLAAVDRDGDGSDEVAFTRAAFEPGGADLYLVEWDASANPSLVQLLEVTTYSGSASSLTAGDVDGDGDDDLVFTQYSPANSDAFVLENVGGSFVTGLLQSGGIGGAPWIGRPHMADWDGDGDDDLMYLDFNFQSKSALIYLGRSEGLTVDFATYWTWPGASEPWGIAGVRDLNGDGHLDLVAGSAVLLGSSVFEPIGKPIVTAGCCAVVTGDAEDVDGDGDLDLFGGSRFVILNDGTGQGPAMDAFDIVLPGTELVDDVLAHGDFDGDGYEDLAVEWGQLDMTFPHFPVFVFLGTRLLRGQADGVFLDGGVAIAGVRVGALYSELRDSADFDGDGNLDVLGFNGWYPGDGAGHFGAKHPGFAGEPRAIADLDGDGDPDLLMRQTSGNLSSWHLHANDGSGNFAEVQSFAVMAPMGEVPLLMDFDRDGRVDLCFATLGGSTTAGLTVAFNQVGGGYAAPVQVLPAEGFERALAGDVNGDGLTDLVGWKSGPGSLGTRLDLWLATATGGVYELESYFGPRSYSIVDLDGDGDGDLISSLLIEATTFDTPSSGSIRQYGFGYGGGPVAPLLGAKGPFRPGTPAAEMRISHGIGGAFYSVFWGTTEVEILNVPFVGAGVFIAPLNQLFVGVLAGAPGAEGEGSVAIDVTAFTAALPGFTVPLQAALMHPGYPSVFALTNAVTIGFGF